MVYIVDRHFAKVGKMVELGAGTKREIIDYKLARYACHLIAMDSDARKQETIDRKVAEISAYILGR